MHPNVDRVQRALEAAGLPGRIRLLPEPAPTAASAAAQLGVQVGQIANSLVFLADGSPLLVLTSGAHRVDTASLGTALGVRITRADAAAVLAATGQPIGGVAPTGHPAPIRTVIDTALAAFDAVWAAGGIPHAVFPTTYDELLRLTGGQPAEVGADG